MAHQIVGTLTLTSHARQTSPHQPTPGESSTIKTNLFDSHGFRREVPFITGNSIRGNLRRFATEVALDVLLDKGQQVPRQIFQIMSRGADSRDGIGITPTAEAMVETTNHVFSGLFGGGPYMIASRYSIGAAIPQIAWCDQMLHPRLRDRAIPLERLSAQTADGRVYDLPLTTTIILTPRDDIAAGKGQKYIENYKMSIDEWLEAVASGRAAKADAKAAAREAKERGEKVAADAPTARSVDTSNFTLNECMLPGTPLQFWMRFKPQATKAQIGLMLMAIKNWANANVLGGNSSQGFGRFEASLSLLDDDTVVAENIFGAGDHATAYTLSANTQSYVAAALSEIDAITVDQLKSVFPYEAVTERKNKADEKAGKKKPANKADEGAGASA